jgi:hypothetical protein
LLMAMLRAAMWRMLKRAEEVAPARAIHAAKPQ